jgi:hypothetical protein
MSLGQGRVQRVRIVRVEDERVDVLRDQRAQVSKLAGRIHVVVDDVDARDLRRAKSGGPVVFGVGVAAGPELQAARMSTTPASIPNIGSRVDLSIT